MEMHLRTSPFFLFFYFFIFLFFYFFIFLFFIIIIFLFFFLVSFLVIISLKCKVMHDCSKPTQKPDLHGREVLVPEDLAVTSLMDPNGKG